MDGIEDVHDALTIATKFVIHSGRVQPTTATRTFQSWWHLHCLSFFSTSASRGPSLSSFLLFPTLPLDAKPLSAGEKRHNSALLDPDNVKAIGREKGITTQGM